MNDINIALMPYIRFPSKSCKHGDVVTLDIYSGDPVLNRKIVWLNNNTLDWEILDDEYVNYGSNINIIIPDFLNENVKFGIADIKTISDHDIEVIENIVAETDVYIEPSIEVKLVNLLKEYYMVISAMGFIAGLCGAYYYKKIRK